MKAVISQISPKLTATLDPAIIAKAKLNLYELALANGFIGSFDAFLASLVRSENSISQDTGNTLTLGADNKLYVPQNTPNQTNIYIKEDW